MSIHVNIINCSFLFSFSLLQSAEKLFEEANRSYTFGDLEQAYILSMRTSYLSRKFEDAHKDSYKEGYYHIHLRSKFLSHHSSKMQQELRKSLRFKCSQESLQKGKKAYLFKNFDDLHAEAEGFDPEGFRQSEIR